MENMMSGESGQEFANEWQADQALLEKANYIGNKQRLKDYITSKFPKEAKSIFDPCCGCSAVLIEAAKMGYQVNGNDLSILPNWYSKGIFEGTTLTEEEAESLLKAAPQDGWLTTEWKGMYPRVKAIRQYIDGVVKKAGSFSGKKQLAAKASVSRLLQTLYGETGSGFGTRNWETLDAVKRVLGKGIAEVNRLIGEVGGKGTITNKDAREMAFPKTDVVYFDPPFFIKNKGSVKYFDSYRITNSILLQKDWREQHTTKEDLLPILKRLCESGREIYISTARNSEIPWASELAKYKKEVKKYKVMYRQNSGLPGGRDSEQKENLLFGKKLEAVEGR